MAGVEGVNGTKATESTKSQDNKPVVKQQQEEEVFPSGTYGGAAINAGKNLAEQWLKDPLETVTIAPATVKMGSAAAQKAKNGLHKAAESLNNFKEEHPIAARILTGFMPEIVGWIDQAVNK